MIETLKQMFTADEPPEVVGVVTEETQAVDRTSIELLETDDGPVMKVKDSFTTPEQAKEEAEEVLRVLEEEGY